MAGKDTDATAVNIRSDMEAEVLIRNIFMSVVLGTIGFFATIILSIS